MKGLLIKDLQLLKNQKQFYLSIVIMFFIFLFVLENPFFILNYLTIFISLFTLSTVSYDEFDNGFLYLFSMPIDRASYVKEKYIFGLILVFTVNIITLSIISIYTSLTLSNISIQDILAAGGTAIVLAIIFLSLSLPIQFKFGAEKGRIALLISFLSIFLIGFLGFKIVSNLGLNLNDIILKIEGIGVIGVVATGIIFCLAIGGISFVSSLKIMKKKDF